MQKVLTSEEMREVDRLTTDKYGIPSIILMENAAHATARIITEKLGGSVKCKSFLILCGKGNNGGDGAALARILDTLDASVDIVLFGAMDDTKGDSKANFDMISKIGIEFIQCETRDEWDNYLYSSIQDWDCVVDAIFGTGLTRPLEGWLHNVVHHINILNEFREDRLRVSVDIPSGLDADKSYQIGENIESDLTVTFTAPKIANVVGSSSYFNGELHIANIGSPEDLIDDCQSQTYLTEKKDAQDWLWQTEFSSDSYKNKRGNALLLVGSKNYSGAAVLAGNAAMVSGVGLVTIATSESAHESVSGRVLPEVITQGLAETKNGAISEKAFEKIVKLSEKADVLAIGSGLNSNEDTTRKLVRAVVENRTTPIVIDADGLNSLSPFDLKGIDELPLILTPHEGEFLRLLGVDNKDAIKDRVLAVRTFSREHNVILVLKGERTLIAEPSGKVVINPTGNSGLGKAGNGDNLTGIIAGFIAQEIAVPKDYDFYAPNVGASPHIESVFNAVVAAVYVAGLAGDIAERKFGKRTMLASDVRESLAEAFRVVLV